MHSLNHAVLGRVIADERAGRHAFRAEFPGAPSARPIPRSAAASPSRPAAWRAVWTARWPAAPSSDQRAGGVRAPRPRRYPRRRGARPPRRPRVVHHRRRLVDPRAGGRPERQRGQPVAGRGDGPAGRRDRRALPPHLRGDLLLHRRRRAHAARRRGGRRPRRRHGRDRARHCRTSSSTPARSRSSCSAAARRRTPTRTPSCCEGRSWRAAWPLLRCCPRPRPRRDAPLIGIGEQHPQLFTRRDLPRRSACATSASSPPGTRCDSDWRARRARRATCRPRAPRACACCSASATRATRGRRTTLPSVQRLRARGRRSSARAIRGSATT